ncbi:MAG: hypothetical protein HQK60_15385 [Deltaproteobacteria bacterium]|nr:hypothetical protein [Deltaproteobacteria bacterium]
MNRMTGILVSTLLMGLVALLGCGPQVDQRYFKDGKQYGVTEGNFRDRWWNFYERSQSFTEGKFYAEAELDLKAALDQREEDQRRARTYGMHFIDYFPHRELGVVYYHTNRFDQAVSELEKSLSQSESAKAKYYLNLARKAIIKKQGAVQQPTLNISSPQPNLTTNAFSLDVSGVARDDSYVSYILVNGIPLFNELAQKELPFKTTVDLKPGDNTIVVEAQNLAGKSTETTIKVKVDRNGPLLAVDEPLDGQSVTLPQVEVKGVVFTNNGVTGLTIGDREVAITPGRTVKFSQVVSLQPGLNQIGLRAKDTVGNETIGKLNVTFAPASAVRPQSQRSAPTPLVQSMFAASLLTATDSSSPRILAAAGPTQSEDKTTPTIRISGLTKKTVVFMESIFLQGQASAPSGVTEVLFKGENLISHPGRNVFFNQIIKLDKGINEIKLTAKDAKGNQVEEQVQIERKVPVGERIGDRMPLAVLPFEIRGEQHLLAGVVYDVLSTSLVDQQRFNLVARGPELLNILQEHKLSKTELADKDHAVKAGKLIGAEAVMTGVANETPNSIEIFCRVIDTETSRILSATDVFDQDKSPQRLKYLLDGLSLKFAQALPVTEGKVIMVKEKEVMVNIGAESSVKEEMRIIIFRPGKVIKDPDSGAILGADNKEIGRTRVTQVMDKFSKSQWISKESPTEVKPKDAVITR